MEKKTKTYRSIVARINAHMRENSIIAVDCSRWYVGISNDPTRRNDEHTRNFGEKICFFKSFYAHTKEIASQIEDYFANKGTINATGSRGAKDDSRWVYVFKAKPTVIDQLNA